MTWTSLVSFIQPSLMTIEELKEPCIEIAQYDVEQVHDGGYQELITLLVPTCELSWCGFSAETFQHHRISFWTCLTSGVTFIMLVSALGTLGINVYAVVFFIPLVVVWVVNVMVYVIIKKHTRNFHVNHTSVTRDRDDDVEKQLASTLRLMVGVFTFNTLPLWLACHFSERIFT